MVHIVVPISAGELIDKITILRIRAEKLTDVAKLDNVRHELDQLVAIRGQSKLDIEDLALWEERLLRLNRELWWLEDELRGHEQSGDFGANFVALARLVYKLNDERSAVKKQISQATGSSIVEEKSYTFVVGRGGSGPSKESSIDAEQLVNKGRR
jgi:hypothetical protein